MAGIGSPGKTRNSIFGVNVLLGSTSWRVSLAFTFEVDPLASAMIGRLSKFGLMMPCPCWFIKEIAKSGETRLKVDPESIIISLGLVDLPS